MAAVQMVIRTTSGDVLTGDWETITGTPEEGHAGFMAALGKPDHVIGVYTDGVATFVRAAAVEWLRLNSR